MVLCGEIPARDGKVRAGRKKITLFINKRDFFSTRLARHPHILVHGKKRRNEAGGKERSVSRQPPARWGGNEDNKGPAGMLQVSRVTRLGSGIILILLLTPTQAQTQKMVGEQKTRGGQ